MRYIITLLALATATFTAFGEYDKYAFPNSRGFDLHSWPRIIVPSGWHHDRTASINYGANCIAPTNSSFYKADVVMYADATYKPQMPTLKTLHDYIESDIATFRKRDPGLIIEKEGNMVSSNGTLLTCMSFTPATTGNWERICYGEDNDYFVTFVISSRSKEGLVKSLTTFGEMVKSF